MPTSFSPQAALAYATVIARPRFAGTPAEGIVADALAERLSSFGYQVRAEPFQFSEAVNIVIVGQLAASLGLIGLMLAGLAWEPRLGAAAALAWLGLLVGHNWLLRRAEQGALLATSIWGRLGRCRIARNVVASGPAGPPDRPHLVLVAHYDSKSQRLPIVVRLVLVALTLGGGLATAGLTGLALAWPAARGIAFGLGCLAVAAGLPLCWLDWDDCSPGAIDNASGVGLVLHLAEVLAQDCRLSTRLRMTVLLTSAEELALMGAAAYVDRHGPEMRAEPGPVYVLNFDGIGVAGWLFYDDRGRTRAGRLAAQVRQAAAALGQPISRFGLPGVLFDHIPFARRGVDAVTLLAAGRETWAVHTPEDAVGRLDVAGFEQAGRLALRLIDQLAGR
jgi:hypothetical protein